MENEIPRLSRLTSILLMLQSNSAVRIEKITEKFAISKRTVYRDIKALEEAGVPVYKSEAGFALMENYNMPPVLFSEEEANALITIEKLILNHSDSSLIAHYNNAVSKVKATLKHSKKDKVELLSDRISILGKKQANKTEFLSLIQSAITNKTILHISYQSIYKNEKTARTLEPLGLYFTNENWIMIAWCQLRNNIREFRIDRIAEIKTGGEKFTRDFNLSEYFAQFFGNAETLVT